MSEYLSEEEQVARMKSWWDENGTSLLVAVVVGIAAVGGWQWYASQSAEENFAAARSYAEFQSAEGAERDSLAASITEQFSGTAYHVFVLFDEARVAVEVGDLAAAETALSAALASADDDLLKDLAKIRLAKVQQGLDRSQQALDTLASIKGAGYRAWALETQGDIHAARGDIAAAHAAYEAAVASLGEGDVRPVLDMKLKNAAPFEGEYVEQTDSLAAALQRAEEALDTPADEAQDEPEDEPEGVTETEPQQDAAADDGADGE